MTAHPTWEQLTAELHEALLTGSADRHDLTCYVDAVREAGRSDTRPGDCYGPEAVYWPAWADIEGDIGPVQPEPPALASVLNAERATVRECFLAAKAAADGGGYDLELAEQVEYLNGKLTALDWVLTQISKRKGTDHA